MIPHNYQVVDVAQLDKGWQKGEENNKNENGKSEQKFARLNIECQRSWVRKQYVSKVLPSKG
jgi:hypothetical protein